MVPTVTISPAPPLVRPALRVLPAPRSEPPTDDERATAGLEDPAMGALLLPLDLTGARPHGRRQGSRDQGSRDQAVPTGALPPDLAAVAATLTADGMSAGGLTAGIPARWSAVTAAADLRRAVPFDVEPSPARLATRRFLATCVEIIGGFRPMAQLRPLCFPEQFSDIAERLAAQPATAVGWRSRGLAHVTSRGALAGRAMVSPPRTGRVNQTGPGDRVMVRRVQICEASDGVAEVAVVLARRDAIWAMALRMERRRGRWLCVHLEVV